MTALSVLSVRRRPLSDCLAAYWNGRTVTYAFLCERGSGAVGEEFNLDDYVWDEWQPTLKAWLAKPIFTFRPEVFQWLADAPPFDAGA
jgi:hypothetical protein